MCTLILLRHAKSSRTSAGLADHDRPLNARGRRAATRMGRLAARRGLVPDRIVSSTAIRARETVTPVVAMSGYRGRVIYDRALYLASPDTIIGLLRQRALGRPARIMVVGHNPGLEDLLRRLTGVAAAMPTAAMARIDLPIDAWRNLDLECAGRLAGFWRPREVVE